MFAAPKTCKRCGSISCKCQPVTEENRPNATQRGYDWRWRKLRAAWLADHPTCEVCEEVGQVTLATQVHHKRKHNGDRQLLLDPDNLQSVCTRCHARLTRAGL